MSKPVFNPSTIAANSTAYDAVSQSGFQSLRKILREPLPIIEAASVGALPSAVTYDRCLAIVNDATLLRPLLYVSDGAAWKLLTKQKEQYILAVEQKDDGIGPSITASADGDGFQYRNITHILKDQTLGASLLFEPSLNSNYLVVPSGTYRYRVMASSLVSIKGEVRIKALDSGGLGGEVTANQALSTDNNAATTNETNVMLFAAGRFTITTTNRLLVQQKFSDAIRPDSADVGIPFGFVASPANKNIFTILELWKEA